MYFFKLWVLKDVGFTGLCTIDFYANIHPPQDCAAIAHVVTVAWNETYKGIVPDWFLEELKTNEPDRAKKTYDEYD